jgi:ABC-2 type transport system ATP-binding protein
MEEVQRVCDRVLILRRGALVHEQDLSQLEEGRVVHIRFAGAAVDPPALPGLHERRRHGDSLTLEYTGPVQQLLVWLAGMPIVELRMEPLGLGAVYYRYHGDPE